MVVGGVVVDEWIAGGYMGSPKEDSETLLSRLERLAKEGVAIER
jgi:hypothetical protein